MERGRGDVTKVSLILDAVHSHPHCSPGRLHAAPRSWQSQRWSVESHLSPPRVDNIDEEKKAAAPCLEPDLLDVQSARNPSWKQSLS
jgi:hypothetical protein